MSKNIIYLFMIVLLSSLASAAILDDIVHYYPFNGNATDVVGTNDGTVVNAVNGASYGKVAEGYYFDGGSTYISTSALTPSASGSFTIAVWAKLHSIDKNSFIIADYDHRGLYLQQNPEGYGGTRGTFRSTFSPNNVYYNFSSNAWTFYVLTFDKPTKNLTYYVNGVKSDSKITDTDTMYNYNIGTRIGNYPGAEATYGYKGNIDEVGVWSRVLSVSEISDILFNSGNGNSYPFTTSVRASLPANNEIFNVDPSFYFVATSTLETNCSLWDNRSGTFSLIDTVVNVTSGDNTSITGTNLDNTEGSYIWSIKCLSGTIPTSTANRTIIIDKTLPIIVFYNPLSDNSSDFYNNFTLEVEISDDNNYLAYINITYQDGTNIYSRTFNTTGVKEYNVSSMINMTETGDYEVVVEAYDGHTDNEIEDLDYNVYDSEIDFFDFSIRSNRSIFDVSAEKNTDRYNINFVKGVGAFAPVPFEVFFVNSDYEIDIVEGSDYEGHIIIKKGDVSDWYWVDFETLSGYNVVLNRINETAVQADVYGMNGDYNFSSVGKLNSLTKTVSYYFNDLNVTLNSTYEANIINGYQTEYLLNVTFNPLFYDYQDTVTNAYLQFEGVNHTAELRELNFDNALYNVTILVNETGAPKDVYHKWHYRIKSRAGNFEFFNTSNVTQNLYDILIGVCGGAVDSEIINFYYYDEIDDSSITASNAYNLQFYDGINYYNVSGSFSGATNNKLCTNLDHLDFTYNWEVSGYLNLQKLLYISRIYTFSNGNEMHVSNNPKTIKNLYLITVTNSSTITYTWRTNQYQLIDGTMEISKCNANGTTSIVESIPIVGGNAVANINLLTSAYSYAVYIDGTRYEGDGFTPCHVESSSTASYFVDLNPIDIMPVIGLHYVNCAMTKVNASVARMTWESNEFSSVPIEGCLKVYRSMVTGLREVYEYCSIAGAYSIERSIPNDGFEYQVRGQLTQGSNTAFCSESLEFYPDTEVSDEFGITGLLGLVFALIAMVLLFAEQGELQLIGVGVGLVGFWMLGVVSLGWAVVMTALSFLVIIFMVGRYSRKN